MAKLHDYYKDEVVKKLMTEFNYNSVMQVPRVEKITLNMGVGEAIADKKLLDNAAADLAAISGQKPLITKARKSVAGFKIRQGYPIGCKVTLRGERMWEFFERLITIAVPRIRDFRGLSAKSFDGRGNYSMGVREQIIFPEIELPQETMRTTCLTAAVTLTRRAGITRQSLQLENSVPTIFVGSVHIRDDRFQFSAFREVFIS